MNIGIIAVLCALMLPWIYGFTLFPDEFGYWATAAEAVGWDWSPVASIGSYYSFGYGWILTPVLMVFKNPISAYRAAIVFNLLCQIVGYVLLCDIGKRLMPKADDRVRIILSGIAATYPAWSFYTQMTMAESVIFCLYVLSVWCMMRYLGSPGMIRLICLIAVLGYMCCVHMRTVGALLAALTVIVVRAIVQSGTRVKREKLIGGLIIGIAAAVVALCVWRDIRLQHLSGIYAYADDSDIAVNSMSGQIDKLMDLLSLRGIGRFMVSLTGKVLYLGCASFGFAYIGAHCMTSEMLDGIRAHYAGRWGTAHRDTDREGSDPSGLYLIGYVILASIAQIIITNIFLIGSADADAERLDLFLHGRYDDYIIPILMMYGIYCVLIKKGQCVRDIVSSGVIMIVLGLIATMVIRTNHNGMRDPHRELMQGMSYLVRNGVRQDNWYVMAEVGLSVFVMVFIWIFIRTYKRSGAILCLMTIIVVQALLAYVSSDTMIRQCQGFIYSDIQLSEHLSELTGSKDGRIVDLYEDGDTEYADVLQFCLRDKQVIPITLRDGEELDLSLISDDDYVLVDWESPLRAQLDGMYTYGYEMGHFALYYN